MWQTDLHNFEAGLVPQREETSTRQKFPNAIPSSPKVLETNHCCQTDQDGPIPYLSMCQGIIKSTFAFRVFTEVRHFVHNRFDLLYG